MAKRLKKKKTRGTRMLLALSDMHCGGDTALMHPDFETKAGNIIGIGHNKSQQFLWAGWTDMVEWVRDVTAGEPYALLINGDAIEGDHHGTKELVAQREHDHVRCAIKCLEELPPPEKTYITRGTECHTTWMEDILAEEMGAVTGKARNVWLLEVAGCLVEAKHHMPTAAKKWTEATQLASCLANAAVNYALCGLRVPRVYLRAHRHCHGWYDNGQAGIGVTGAWQFLTRHGHKAVPDSIPVPGAILLDWRDLHDGALPTDHRFIVEPKQPSIEKV